jgi:hypothetical protein
LTHVPVVSLRVRLRLKNEAVKLAEKAMKGTSIEPDEDE